MTQENSRFPLYLMIVNGERKWLKINRAGVVYDDGFMPVRIGGSVLEEDGSEREITNEERQKIVNIADEYSGSK